MFPLRDSIKHRRFPLVNYCFIIINLVVFFKEAQIAHLGSIEPFIFKYGLIPSLFLSSPLEHIPNIFTSMFLHGGWGHVLGNMWFLYIFGDNVEDSMGRVRYFFYYLLMGVGAAMVQVYMNPTGRIPMVGASGAIAGVLGGYFLLYPGAKVLTFFIFIIFVRIIEIPAFFYLLLWFVTQAVNGVGSLDPRITRAETGGVAWWAHAGGFASGFIFITLFRRRRR